MLSEKPLVSVLMTSYNREKYIGESIRSVQASTYSNWELIILDDGSKDSTFSIAQQFAAQDSRIKVYRNKVNLGQFKNRNEIVKYASGKYLKYLDSDDLIYPYGLDQLVYYMEQFPEAGYGLCSIRQDDNRIFPYLLSPEESYKAHYLHGRGIFYKAPLSSIIKKEAFTKVGGFPHEAASGDFAMWNHIACHYSVVLMPQGIVWYRSHPEQVNVWQAQKSRESYLVEFEYMKVAEYYLQNDNCPLSKENKIKSLKKIKKAQLKYVLTKSVRDSIGTGLELYNVYNAKPKLISATV